ncbi:hypothetical protein FGF1_03660 [Flavobacteriaceae bacterium GF1]
MSDKAKDFVEEFMHAFDENGLASSEKVMYLRARQVLGELRKQRGFYFQLKAENERLKKLLLEAFKVENSKYESRCNQAHWYNNNMPNVGTSIDYKPLPKKSKWLEEVETLMPSIGKNHH